MVGVPVFKEQTLLKVPIKKKKKKIRVASQPYLCIQMSTLQYFVDLIWISAFMRKK